MWAWTPAFVAAVFAVSGAGSVRAAELASYVSAVFHVMGLVASSSMGRLSDGLGRRIVLFGLAATSAVCSLTFGWLIGLPIAVVFVVGAVYGFTALGDSPVLSTALTQEVGAAHLGAARPRQPGGLPRRRAGGTRGGEEPDRALRARGDGAELGHCGRRSAAHVRRHRPAALLRAGG